MTCATIDPLREQAHRSWTRFAVGVAVPVLVVALAYILWWVSDRLGDIGPFDRAAFGWSVVIPVWLAAPVAAGFVWHRLGDHHNGLTAGMFGTLIGGVAAALFWMAVADPACETGPTRVPAEWVVPSLVLGAAIGGGLAFSALVASRTFQHGRLWQAVVLGAGTELTIVFVAILVAGILLQGPGCQRPTV